ncbi:STAS domain-containing protein [Saccharopolyspora taberi]|uniref:Anti-sigma factor antagonist n=1 Tax=Saccharopolyspora taberi TaxID=60895 RepID=A0ABN3VEQ2_9PSEU
MPASSDPCGPPAPFDITIRRSHRLLLAEVVGEVELVNAPKVESELMAALGEQPDVLVVDASRVSFLSSAGLAVLMRVRNSAAGRTRFRVVADSPATLRPIQLTGLDQEIEIFSTRERAIAMAGDR